MKSFSNVVFFVCVTFVFSLSFAGEKPSAFIKSKNDERDYRSLTLENGLKVLLISDSKTTKSAAALDVNVGAGSDPVPRYGLAHFLEHMLFLGTEKYPVPGEFQDFVEGHGGGHNAYTSLEHTNYFFDITPEYLEPAFDRFSQFFIAPLFLEEYVERERRAVHSEYTAKISSPFRREKDVLNTLVVQGHPLSKFSTGNAQTLGKDAPKALREILIDFHETYYLPTNMSLVVLSSHSLDVLEKMVTTRFDQMEKSDKRVVFPASDKLFEEGALPVEVHVKPKRDSRKLSVMFPLPSARDHHEVKPLYYIGNLLGHEGKGSLLSALKHKGWVTSLSAGTSLNWRDGELFGVNIMLTPEGMNHIGDIYALVFDTLDLVRQSGVEKWRFDELAAITKISFDYGEKGEPIREVSSLANALHETPAEEIFWRPYAFKSFDKKVLQNYLNKMTPENAVTFVVSPDVEPQKRSQFYGTGYRIATSETSWVSTAKRSESYSELKLSLALPRANPYLPEDFSIIGEKVEEKDRLVPQLVTDKDHVRGWFLNDDIYDLPRTSITARFLLPNVATSSEHFAAVKLYQRIIQVILSDEGYEAAMAGLSYSLSATPRGVDLEFYGYSDALPTLVDKVVKTLKKFNSSKRYRKSVIEDYFASLHAELNRSVANRKFGKAYSQVLGELPALAYTPFWSQADIEQGVSDLSEEAFSSFIPTMFDGGKVEALVFGNTSKKEARRYVKRLAKLIEKGDELESSASVVKFADKKGFMKHHPIQEADHAVALYFQGVDDSLETRANVKLLEKMLSTPVYQTLRTEQQLGYIVFSAYYPVRQVPGLLIVVQSPGYNAEEIYQRVQNFLREGKASLLANISRDKEALKRNLLEPPTSQMQWSNHFWNLILDKDEKFDSIQQLLNLVDGITPESVEAVYDSLLIDSLPALVLIASKNAESLDPLASELVQIKQGQQFKAEMPGYSYP